MEDYTQLAELYNQVLAKSKEMDAQIQTQDAQILELQDGIEQLQEVIQDEKNTNAKQATVIEYLQKQQTQATREGTPQSKVLTTTMKNKSTKLPDPPILIDGKEPAYDDWLAKMQSKLEAN